MIAKDKIKNLTSEEKDELIRELFEKAQRSGEELGKLREEENRLLREENALLKKALHRASVEKNRSLEVQTRDQERRLIFKIDQALERINNETYGFCEEAGYPISLARLEAYPMATLCLEAQDLFERFKKNHQPKRF